MHQLWEVKADHLFVLHFFVSRAAVGVLGAMYEKLGRMMGSSYPDTIQNLIKALKNAEVGTT